ncbi:integrator complex subunit 1 homolog [Topomyia yanbarensis]|uniref:integrator complex subunit 1 homolog n=1 Tax=Topomyia yanbarensis TaxID=2498891 RepID=UPI00273B1F66|nr:integrator complex subunit 1 homolog [Topomyia yanbarensis]
MSCSVTSCNISDDRFLWQCEFCRKCYHAACVGVQRNQEEFISHFMIPLCADCQHNLKVGIDTRKVLYQQEKLFESITTQTDCNLQIAADIKKFNSIVDLFENVELQLKESVANVNINTSSQVANAVSALSQAIDSNSFNKADELVTLKNHITSLFNISMGSTKKHIEEYVNDLTADLTRELKKICSEVQNLSTLTIDMAAHCNEHYLSESRPTREVLDEVKIITNSVGSDILKEVQSLAGSINTLDSSIRDACLPPAGPSLMDELNAQSTKSGDSGHRSTAEATEGWRFLGSKKVWRSDWTEYDTRNQRRIQQQKMKDRAMTRRKANKKQLHRISRSSYYNYNLNDNNNSNNNSNNNRNNNRNNNSSNNRNNNNNTQCGRPTAGNSLPRDKDLLAAARVQFSRPPFENQRGIRFQRGETLNPYPVVHQFNSTFAPDRIVERLTWDTVSLIGLEGWTGPFPAIHDCDETDAID